MEGRLVSVALPVPLLTPFTYRVPPSLRWPERGVRVLVPLGRRRMIGVVVGSGVSPVDIEAKDVLEVLDPVPLVSGTLVDLAAWLADYYLAAPGEALRLVFPPSGVKASRTMVRLADPAGAPAEQRDPVLAALVAGP